ncbi:hypothetical protein MPDQ_007095 [Monascus purpureus]|uniref:Saccharopine dehydrogenase NADP binding domain-containing protein n=1 Tax=Monascus purpureus TaxID=5098 RepID=A0A507R5C6_MONPU|nr:hypothetical protein MPDQ_007095 [Monascus purpureus]
MASSRQFDIILLGPTGYTGKWCAEHIVQYLPTDLKWALAGRSLQKIEGVAADLKKLNPDRIAPGETPWVKSMIEKYHETAKASGAVLIHSVGIESALADILTWSVVKRFHDDFSSPVREVTCCVSDQKTSGASGGTLLTLLTTIEALPLSKMLETSDPFALAASPPPEDIPSSTLSEKILGVCSVRDLGTLTTSPFAFVDVPTVHRSSTLFPNLYGSRFYFREFIRVRNVLVGVLVHFAIVAVFLLLLTRPFRWLVKKVVYAPGNGPRREDSVNDFTEYLAVATEDTDVATPKRVIGRLECRKTLYELTGLLLAEAAMVIVMHEEKVKEVSGCGIVTPAALGQEFVDRIEKVGCRIETKVLGNQ